MADIASRATGYGIPGEVVDGQDVIAVYNIAKKAVERARKGLCPTLIECKTYRQKGHSRFDPAAYRPKEEVETWLKKDPIVRLQTKLFEMGILTEAETQKMVQEVDKAVEEATKFAVESPFPEPEEALEDVYASEESASIK